jgi:hypothetical protein
MGPPGYSLVFLTAEQAGEKTSCASLRLGASLQRNKDWNGRRTHHEGLKDTNQGGFETRPYIFLRPLRLDFSYFVFFGYFVVKICRFIRILSCVYASLTYNQERCSLFKGDVHGN